MLSFRTLVALVAFATTSLSAVAGSHPTTANDARTETATPTFPGMAQAVRRATAGLLDALRLSTAQATRLQARTEAELRDLMLAATPAATAEAEQRYLLALGRVLTASQFAHYCVLRASLESPLAYLQTAERR